MSSIKQELLAAIEQAPDEVVAKTLLFLQALTETEIGTKNSNLDGFSEFLQSDGFYEDEFIDRCMAEIESK